MSIVERANPKRLLVALAVVAVVVAGGAAAYATTKSEAAAPTTRKGAIKALTPDQRAALKDCLKKARVDHRGDRPAIREAVKACLTQAGIDPNVLARGLKGVRPQVKALPPDKKAALKACVKSARADHKGDPRAVRDAVKACLAQAGITVPGA